MKHNGIQKIILAATFFILGLSTVLSADTGPQPSDPAVMKRLDELSNQVRELQQFVKNQNEVIKIQAAEIEGLKATRDGKAPSYIPSPPDQKAGAIPWYEGMKQGGDIRLRYEAFDNHGGTDQDRNRFQVRLRYGIEKTLGEDFTVGFRLATGSTSNPTSTNQTLGGVFVYKSVVFDKLFAKYVPSQLIDFGPIAKVEVGGGKAENPFVRGTPQSQMVWDFDVTPEGIYETVDFEPLQFGNSKLSTYLIGGQFPVVENATAGSVDAEIYGVMGGFNLDTPVPGFEKAVTWSGAIAYYDYADFGINGSFGDFARGNTIDPASATTLLAKDFNILNIYTQLKIQTPYVPVSPFFDFANNLGDEVGSLKPGNLNDAWGWGIKLGDAKKKGEWEASYAYYFVEPNAVVGAFNDSDFGGPGFNGHADRRGSVVKLGYKLSDYLTLNLTGYFVNTVTNLPDEETRRFQSDLSWRF